MKKGFTLVEVFIVLAIIGLIAAIAVPSWTTAWKKRQATANAPILVENPTANPSGSISNAITNEFEGWKVIGLQKIDLPGIQETYILRVKDTRCSLADERAFIFNYKWCTQIK